MIPVTVVIITNNEAEAIVSCVNACKLISDDIVIVDNDSTDGTPIIGNLSGCRVFNEDWDGYGANKNKGIRRAKYDWILSIDADEIPDMALVRSLHETNLDDPLFVIVICFFLFFCFFFFCFGVWFCVF